MMHYNLVANFKILRDFVKVNEINMLRLRGAMAP